jgi:hypothetical protein
VKSITLCLVFSVLCGCATMEKYPKTTRFIAGSLVLSGIAYAAHSHNEPVGRPDICNGGVSCR